MEAARTSPFVVPAVIQTCGIWHSSFKYLSHHLEGGTNAKLYVESIMNSNFPCCSVCPGRYLLEPGPKQFAEARLGGKFVAFPHAEINACNCLVQKL